MANIKIEELCPTEVDNQVTDLTEVELSVTGGGLVNLGVGDINVIRDINILNATANNTNNF